MSAKDFIPDYPQYPSEFEGDSHFYVIFATNGLQMGRMIAASKSTYCKQHPDDFVIFNANVITKKHGKVWFGDLNLTEDFESLKNVADQIGEDLYVLMEGDARFGYENQHIDVLISKAKTIIRCKKCIEKQNGKEKKASRLSSRKNKKS